MKALVDLFKTFWTKPWFRFLFAGGLNTLFGYSVYTLLIFLKLPYPLAVLFSTLLGIAFNFGTIGGMVFRNPSKALIPKFIAVYAAVYLLNLGAIRLLLSTGIGPLYSGYICILPLAVLSYALNKAFVFSAPPKKPDGT